MSRMLFDTSSTIGSRLYVVAFFCSVFWFRSVICSADGFYSFFSIQTHSYSVHIYSFMFLFYLVRHRQIQDMICLPHVAALHFWVHQMPSGLFGLHLQDAQWTQWTDGSKTAARFISCCLAAAIRAPSTRQLMVLSRRGALSLSTHK